MGSEIETKGVAPATYAGVFRSEIIGQSVRVRPFYHDGAGRSCRYRLTLTGDVIGTYGTGMVLVRFWDESMGTKAHYPKELHVIARCVCDACIGIGITEYDGA